MLLNQEADLRGTSGFPPQDARSRGRAMEFHRSNHPSGEVEERKIHNRIFVGGLKETINEDDLRELFGKFGEIKEVQLKDRGAKNDETRRGHGFITYKTREQAAVALREGRGEVLEIRGTKLNVCQAVRRIGNKGQTGRLSDGPVLGSRSELPSSIHSSRVMPPVPPAMPGAYPQYPGMYPYAYSSLNPYSLAMLNAGYAMPSYGWPYYPPSPSAYSCSMPSSHGGDQRCDFCCDGHSETSHDSQADVVNSSPESSPPRNWKDYQYPDCLSSMPASRSSLSTRPNSLGPINGYGCTATPVRREKYPFADDRMLNMKFNHAAF